MRLVGFSIDGDSVPGRLRGSMSLDDLSVITGKNGLGKTRVLEAVASALQREMGWGRQDPFGGFGHEGLAWLDVEVHPGVVDADWEWLSELTTMNPGPPGLVTSGRFRYWRPGCEVPAAEDESFDSWGARVASHLSAKPGSLHEELVLALLQRPIVDVMNLEQGTVTLGFMPARISKAERDLASRLLESDDEASRTMAMSCLDLDRDFVSLLELGEFPAGDPGAWQPLLPPPYYLGTDSVDLDSEAEDVLIEVLRGPLERPDADGYLRHREQAPPGRREPDRWVVYADEEAGLDPAIEVALAAINRETNLLAPEFVKRGMTIEIETYPLELWTGTLPRLTVSVSPEESETLIAGNLLGAGSKRWVLAAMREAGRRLAQGSLVGPGVPVAAEGFEASVARREAMESAVRDGTATIEPVTTPAVFIIDEPELHLHPLALEEVAAWIRLRASEGSHVLVATHSPGFLGHMNGAAVGVLVEEAEGVRLREVSDTGLAALEELATELGFGKGVWLQLTRGVLIVEGQHDLMVIDKFFGDELERQAIRVLALRGTKNTKRFIESDFLGRAGIPLRVLFDNVRAEALNERRDVQAFSGEEAELFQLLNQLAQGHDISAVPFEAPDIICALPEDAVTRAYPNATFPGWVALEEEWRGTEQRQNFKNFARKRMGIDSEVSSDAFVAKVLGCSRPDETLGAGLKGAMALVFESV